MNIILKQGVLFKNIFASLNDFCTCLSLKINKDGLSFQGMDASHVSMCELQLKRSDFSTFELKNEEELIQLGISVCNLNRILKLVNSNDALQLLYDKENEPDILVVKMEKVMIKLRLMEIMDDEALESPEMDFSHKISFNSKEFTRQILDLADIGQEICFDFNDKGDLKMSTTGDIGDIDFFIPGVTDQRVPIKMNYSLTCMKRFTKAHTLSDRVHLQFSSQMPVRIIYPFQSSYMVFYLAPKMDE